MDKMCFTREEAAEYLRVSVQVVDKMLARKVNPIPHTCLGRRILIPCDKLNAWLDTQSANDTAWGDFIKSRRLDLGMTLEQVGDLCGVSKATVKRWEGGMEPGRLNLLKLAEALNLTIEELMKGDLT